MRSNLSFFRSKYGFNFQSHSLALATTVEQLDSQSNCLIEHLRILSRSRCNEYVINGFTYDYVITVTIVFLYLFMYEIIYLLRKITIK